MLPFAVNILTIPISAATPKLWLILSGVTNLHRLFKLTEGKINVSVNNVTCVLIEEMFSNLIVCTERLSKNTDSSN